MWLIFFWLVGIPKLLYHFFLSSTLLMLFLCYKISGAQQVGAVSQVQSQEQSRRRLLLAGGGRLRDKIKSVIMRQTSGGTGLSGREGLNQILNQQGNNLFGQSPTANNNAVRSHDERRFYLANLAVVYVLLVVSCWPTVTYCLEQDAAILEPVANITKSVIKTVTLGVPLEINFDPGALIKNFAYFTWRTRFPVSMPSGFMQKAQDFYNRVKTRVDHTEVADVERKSLANLKVDLDDIVDSIVEEVRRSPDGLYTDYLQTRVNGVPLEDACTAVGVQLKAYGVDLTNYRNIAGMVLGIPVMPTVASAVVNVASLANMEAMRNLTSSLHAKNATLFLANMPNTAAQSVSMMSNSIGNLRQQLPVQSVVTVPMSLLSSGQRIFTSQMAAQGPQPVFA